MAQRIASFPGCTKSKQYLIESTKTTLCTAVVGMYVSYFTYT